MVQDCSRIGVPYSSQGTTNNLFITIIQGIVLFSVASHPVTGVKPVFYAHRTHAELRHVHGGEVAPDSGVCPGRHRQRELLHHEVSGEPPSSPPAQAPVALRHLRVRLFFSPPADGHERETVGGLRPTGPGVPEPGRHRGTFTSVLFISCSTMKRSTEQR